MFNKIGHLLWRIGVIDNGYNLTGRGVLIYLLLGALLEGAVAFYTGPNAGKLPPGTDCRVWTNHGAVLCR